MQYPSPNPPPPPPLPQSPRFSSPTFEDWHTVVRTKVTISFGGGTFSAYFSRLEEPISKFGSAAIASASTLYKKE